jgi:hypothetical protein
LVWWPTFQGLLKNLCFFGHRDGISVIPPG